MAITDQEIRSRLERLEVNAERTTGMLVTILANLGARVQAVESGIYSPPKRHWWNRKC